MGGCQSSHPMGGCQSSANGLAKTADAVRHVHTTDNQIKQQSHCLPSSPSSSPVIAFGVDCIHGWSRMSQPINQSKSAPISHVTIQLHPLNNPPSSTASAPCAPPRPPPPLLPPHLPPLPPSAARASRLAPPPPPPIACAAGGAWATGAGPVPRHGGSAGPGCGCGLLFVCWVRGGMGGRVTSSALLRCLTHNTIYT